MTGRAGADSATFAWDFDGRLIRAAMANGTVVTHAYDADGNRVHTEVTPANGPPQVTNYLVDTSGALAQVVVESDAAAHPNAYYLRGDELLAVIRPSGTRFYHADGLGSIRSLTDESGAETDHYATTAFGELLTHTGSDPNPYLFAGEAVDPSSGLSYHRARWMDPGVGRFASQDPSAGLILEPSTLHRYLYASGDPVNRTDPSGYISNLIYGQRVHEYIGLDFETSAPGRDWDLAISRIVGKTPYVGRLRPDLIDFLNKQIYEIKPVTQIAEGEFQLTGYILILNWADPDKSRPWTRGTAANYTPPRTIPVGYGAMALVTPPVLGLIVYDVYDLKVAIAALAAIAVASMTAQMSEISADIGVAAFVGF
jgi:RHS repeat-associated protein